MMILKRCFMRLLCRHSVFTLICLVAVMLYVFTSVSFSVKYPRFYNKVIIVLLLEIITKGHYRTHRGDHSLNYYPTAANTVQMTVQTVYSDIVQLFIRYKTCCMSPYRLARARKTVYSSWVINLLLGVLVCSILCSFGV